MHVESFCGEKLGPPGGFNQEKRGRDTCYPQILEGSQAEVALNLLPGARRLIKEAEWAQYKEDFLMVRAM